MTAGRAVNYVSAGARVRAVCEICGRKSASVVPDADGEPDLWKLARGWSTAPFPPDFVHEDGSVGSNFTCPACNAAFRAGARLRARSYLHAEALLARVAQK